MRASCLNRTAYAGSPTAHPQKINLTVSGVHEKSIICELSSKRGRFRRRSRGAVFETSSLGRRSVVMVLMLFAVGGKCGREAWSGYAFGHN